MQIYKNEVEKETEAESENSSDSAEAENGISDDDSDSDEDDFEQSSKWIKFYRKFQELKHVITEEFLTSKKNGTNFNILCT